MVLLRISYRYGPGASSNFALNCNLVRFGAYIEKLCQEKMPILRCTVPPKN